MLFANLSFLGFGGLIHTLSCDVQEPDDAYAYEDDNILDSVLDPIIDSVNHQDP
jgi:hypothetical protein